MGVEVEASPVDNLNILCAKCRHKLFRQSRDALRTKDEDYNNNFKSKM